MKKVLVPLAPGCEELEAVTIIDILRRGGVTVVTAALSKEPVVAGHGLQLLADMLLTEAMADDDFDMVAVPGGMGGTEALLDTPPFLLFLQRMAQQGRFIGAICAAPLLLEKAGLLENLRFTAYPGVLNLQPNSTAEYTGKEVEIDKTIITSRGPGTALDFALVLLEALVGTPKRNEVEKQLVRQ
ncbi:MAG: DJ-1 family glyoxalase III [Candidatus Hydrogenedentales bacterium]